MSNYFRADTTREVAIFRRAAPAGYTMIPDMPPGSVQAVTEWWRTVDRDTVAETWHPIIQSQEEEVALPPGIAGSGVNILPRLYSSFDGDVPPPNMRSAMDYELYPDGYNSDQCLLLTSTGPNAYIWLAAHDSDWPIKLTAGKRWILSAWTKAPTANQPWTVRINTTGDGSTSDTLEFATATSASANFWKRQSLILDLSQSEATRARFGIKLLSGGMTMNCDGVMLEEQVGDGQSPSAFVDGPA